MKCFVTGADESYADILDWFIDHYNQHISLPLYIADFGLKRTYPNSFKIKWKDNAWYYKPRAIKECPGDQVCWIDVDCEILADISDVFELTKKDIGVTEDFCRTRSWNPYGLLPLATGVCCFNSKNQLLDDWIKESESRKHRGDQEALNHLLKNHDQVSFLPRGYQWLRLAEPNNQIKVMHWTGNDGKYIIRNNETINGKKPT